MDVNPEQTDPLWLSYRSTPTAELRNQLVERYFPLVQRIATKLVSRMPFCVDADDMASAGFFGLVRSIKSYDPSRGVKFETYCSMSVRGSMVDHLREMDWVPRVARIKEKAGLAQTVGVLSLYEQCGDKGDPVRIIDELVDASADDPSCVAHRNDVRHLVLKDLSLAARHFVHQHYYEGTTLRDAAAMLGLSPSRGSQLHASAMKKLAHKLASRVDEFTV